MSDLATGPDWLQEDLRAVEALLEATAGASAHPLVSEPSLHLLKAGGKRMRPALTMICARGGSPTDATLLSAASIELVHLATLYHDDVIDETETRRGVPTAHAKWGTEVAVLAGDYLFACGCGLGADAGGEVPGILARAIARVCEGQIVETASLEDARRSVDAYLDTIGMKTAALFAAACELGAVTSGQDPIARAALADYGERLGLAFQIIDDLLDLVGDPRVTGKEPGTDLREGVYTMPVLLACERDPQLATRLEQGRRDLTGTIDSLRATGALLDSWAHAARIAAEAERSLASFPDEGGGELLISLLRATLAQVDETVL